METERSKVLFQEEIGEEPPKVSFGILLDNFRSRGFKETMNDESLGPHTHLLLLLSMIFLISIIIGIYLAVA